MDGSLLLPTTRSLRDAATSEVSQQRERFDRFFALWRNLADLSALDARTTTKLIEASAGAYDDWAKYHDRAHWNLASAYAALGAEYDRSPELRRVLLPNRIGIPAPTVDNLIVAPLRELAAQRPLRLPVIHRQLAIDLKTALAKEPFRGAIRTANAETASSVAGLPGAILGLALLQRVIDARQLALLNRISPQPTRLESRLLSAQLQQLGVAGPTTWRDLVRDYLSDEGLPGAGITECQVNKSQWGSALRQATVSHAYFFNNYQKNPALIGWALAAEMLDTPGLEVSALEVVSGMARRDLEPAHMVLTNEDSPLSDIRRFSLLPGWQRSRSMRPNQLLLNRSYLSRKREQAEQEVAPEIASRAGQLFWDSASGLIFQITGERRLALRQDSGGPENPRGFELRVFAIGDDGTKAELTMRTPCRSDGTVAFVPERIGDAIAEGRWQYLGEAESGAAFLSFDQPVHEWLDAASPPELDIGAWGLAPPHDMATWAMSLDRGFFYEPSSDSWVSLGVRAPAGKRPVPEIYHRRFERAVVYGEQVRQRVGEETTPSPFSIWMSLQHGHLRREPNLSRSATGTFTVSGASTQKQTQVLEVRRRKAILPAPLAEASTARTWARDKIGTVFDTGTTAMRVLSVDNSGAYPSLRVSSWTGKGLPAKWPAAEPMTCRELWWTIRSIRKHLETEPSTDPVIAPTYLTVSRPSQISSEPTTGTIGL